MEKAQTKEQECCPPFDPDPWHNQIIEWDKKKFIKEKGCRLKNGICGTPPALNAQKNTVRIMSS